MADEAVFAMRFKLQRSKDPKQPYNYFEIQAAGNYETLATSDLRIQG